MRLFTLVSVHVAVPPVAGVVVEGSVVVDVTLVHAALLHLSTLKEVSSVDLSVNVTSSAGLVFLLTTTEVLAAEMATGVIGTGTGGGGDGLGGGGDGLGGGGLGGGLGGRVGGGVGGEGLGGRLGGGGGLGVMVPGVKVALIAYWPIVA